MRVFASTRDVTALLSQADGSLRIESSGGATAVSPTGKTELRERREFLPARTRFPAPPKNSRGAFVTARLPDGTTAVFADDRLWLGERPGPALPPHLREVTALVRWQGTLVLGARRQGAWILDGSAWRPLTDHRDEPADHNIQSLAFFQNALYASSLDQGLLRWVPPNLGAEGEWSQILAPTLSTDAPRQLFVHGGTLLVRHGDGQIDGFDGRVWARDVLRAALPRRQASSLASDGVRRLLATSWGGFSVCEGGAWSHRYDLPALQGAAVTCALLDGERFWLGTQGKGLIEVTGTDARRHDERIGLPDDWITGLTKTPDGTLWAGTFVGGLTRIRPGASRWETLAETRCQQVTALLPDGNNLLAATRAAIWRVGPGGETRPISVHEVQALGFGPGGLWAGSRVALYAGV